MKRSVNCSSYKQPYTKQNNVKKYFFMFALQIIPGRPTYCRGVETVRWGAIQAPPAADKAK